MRNNNAPNYVVTKEEFDEYYNNVSMSIDDDQYFTLMMNNAWKLTEESRMGSAKKSWSNQSPGPRGDNNIFNRPKPVAQKEEAGMVANATEAQVIEHIRKKIAARGARGLSGIAKKFKIADDNNSKSLDAGEFKKAMHDFRIGLNA